MLRLRIVFARPQENAKIMCIRLSKHYSIPYGARVMLYMMYDVIVFENRRFRPYGTGKREDCVFKNLHSEEHF